MTGERERSRGNEDSIIEHKVRILEDALTRMSDQLRKTNQKYDREKDIFMNKIKITGYRTQELEECFRRIGKFFDENLIVRHGSYEMDSRSLSKLREIFPRQLQ